MPPATPSGDAAEVRMVRDVADEADQLAFVEGGRDRVEIHDVLAAPVGVVHQDHVAGREVFRPVFLHQLAHRIPEAEVPGVMRLRDGSALRVGDDAGDVLDLGMIVERPV
ncbi:MAG: hypothetical protein U1F37_09985 [Alphaproteobacteria bacterium]